jgi:transposase
MLRDRGLKTQNMTTARRAADIPDEVLRKHVNEGLPVRSIALLLQVPYSELYYVMRDKNIKTRLKEQKQVREGLSLDDIREYVSQGLSNKEIAKRLQMDETALGSLMAKHGIASARATRIAGFQALSREELQGYANRGLSYEQIAEESGTTLHLIRKMMAEHGIKTQEIARRESLKTITPEMIQACLNEGMTKQQVAEHFKVSPTRIKAVTRKPRRTARTPISYEQLKAYVDQGMTLQQIADELDVSIVTAARRLKESNLTTKISVPKSRLEEMISQGLTKKEMAEALSISITTLYTLLRKAGLD